jgi:glucose uptake protein
MAGILSALVTVLAWGAWLAPSQNVQYKSQQIKTFYVAAANLALTLLVWGVGERQVLAAAPFWMAFAGGLVWAVSGACAFSATSKLGLARAFGLWAPLNIMVSLLWGALLFHEFPKTSLINQIILLGSVVVILAGVLLIIFARGAGEKTQGKNALGGYLGAVGAGILWGSYYIPIKMAQASPWAAALPLALGILCGSIILALISRQSFKLEKTSDALRTCSSGVLWGIGNYGMLFLVEQIGAGRGFTISQLALVVGALISIYWLKDPAPKTRAARLTFAGIILTTIGGIALGNIH